MESTDIDNPLVYRMADAMDLGDLVSLDEADKVEAGEWWLDECIEAVYDHGYPL